VKLLTATLLAQPSPDAARIPKFCRKCGAAWQSLWTTCAVCDRQPSRENADLTGEKKDLSIQAALVLYFSLLVLCGINIVSGETMRDSFNAGFTIELLMSLLVLVWAVAQWRANLAGLLRIPSLAWFGLALGLSLATFTIGAWVINGIRFMFDLPVTKISTPFLQHGYGTGMIILCVAVQPAIIEELAFRGIILGGMLRILSTFEAVAVSALMFMTLHLSIARFPHTLALGLAAGFLRVRSKSILPCILLHFSHNYLCLLMEWMVK
jgi:membrane protease YdiL (CAAX protease family)